MYIKGVGQMNKSVLIYFAVLVLMVVAALFLSGVLGKQGASSTTTAPVSTSAPTTSLPPNVSTTSTSTTITTTTVMISPCQSSNATESIPNGDFSLGNFNGWSSSSGVGEAPGFGSVPFNLTYANAHGGYYDSPWNGYKGSYFATTYHNGLLLQPGNLTSQPFRVDELYLNFKIISPQSDKMYVEILENGTPMVIAHYDTFKAQGVNNSLSTFVNASIPLVTMLCKNVSIRVYDGILGSESNEYDYIAVGDFYKSATQVSTPGIVVNETIN